MSLIVDARIQSVGAAAGAFALYREEEEMLGLSLRVSPCSLGILLPNQSN